MNVEEFHPKENLHQSTTSKNKRDDIDYYFFLFLKDLNRYGLAYDLITQISRQIR